jgi:NAD(P)H-hydrate epimerase
LQRAGTLVLGPGLGAAAWGRGLFEQALASGRPLVLDADGLNLLAGHSGLRRDDWVLTPHPGEAARLLKVCVAEVQEDRFAAAAALQQRYGGTIVLKGPGTLTAGGDNVPPSVCSDGNPGMASGGMGDVLSGVVAAFMAQGRLPREAAELGVCLHAAAADSASRAGGERGLLASDLMPYLRSLGNPA